MRHLGEAAAVAGGEVNGEWSTVKALFQSAVLVAVFAISYALGAHPVLVGVLSGWSWVAAGWLGECIADRCDRA